MAERLLPRAEVERMVGLKRSAIYARVEAELRARLPDNAMEVSNG